MYLFEVIACGLTEESQVDADADITMNRGDADITMNRGVFC
jgi:hypothetical protein